MFPVFLLVEISIFIWSWLVIPHTCFRGR
jgi:hypothetical protein